MSGLSTARLRQLAAVALAASVLVPSGWVRGAPALCAFHAVTGRPCPSCGMTRSWNAMGHGRVNEAFGYHLLGPLTFAGAVLAVVAGDRAVSAVLARGRERRPAIAALAGAWLAAWAVQLMRQRRG